jgi:hypothetical protein
VSDDGELGDGQRLTTLCSAFLAGYTSDHTESLTCRECVAVPVQIECLGMHFLLARLMWEWRYHSPREIYQQEYLDIIDWLDACAPDLVSLLKSHIG